jgi:hypothetical protein
MFPFLNGIFHSPYFDAESFVDPRFQSPLNWRVPYDLTFHTRRFLESQDGAIGFTYLFVILGLLLAPWARFRKESLSALAVAAVYFVITWRSASNIRYLVPVLPILLFAFACYLGALRQSQENLYRASCCMLAGTVLVGMYLLPSSGFWHKNFCLSPVAFAEEARVYIEAHAPSRVLVAHLNATAPGEPVAFFANGIAGLDARAYSTGWHNFTFLRDVRRANSAEKVKDLMERSGVRHFVTPLPRCGTAPLPQLEAFLAKYTRERFRAGCLFIADWR